MPKLKAPDSGITVRMYRQGHGDCFLLAMRGEDGGPFYLLIDCGLWAGSKIDADITEIIADIGMATDNHLNAVLITHEHMDHVNGFEQKAAFAEIAIDEAWLGWTEDGTDPFANDLRVRNNDTLLALAGAALKMRPPAVAAEAEPSYTSIEQLLMFETGAENHEQLYEALGDLHTGPVLAADGTKKISDAVRRLKNAVKSVRDKASKGVRFFKPGEHHLPAGSAGPRVFALGPPRDEKLLLSLDPKSKEGFHLDGLALGLMAATAPDTDPMRSRGRIFDKRFGLPRKDINHPSNDAALESLIRSAYGQDMPVSIIRAFFNDNYGREKDDPEEDGLQAWRQIDQDWLNSAETLALRLNNEVNNTSLVVAFELPNTGKVLLFTGDAQRGSWISWSTLEWAVNDKKVKAKDLLGRTVFYKTGHHGSHNATLHGEVTSDYANLAWLGTGKYEDEFVAVIPANRKWAYEKKGPWRHPLASIETALLEKAKGRVFRSDLEEVARPDSVKEEVWSQFKHEATRLYFEYTVTDK